MGWEVGEASCSKLNEGECQKAGRKQQQKRILMTNDLNMASDGKELYNWWVARMWNAINKFKEHESQHISIIEVIL